MKKDHYHVAGIAGVGMSAAAQLLHHHGFTVTGSDRFCDQGHALPVLEKLKALGIQMYPQDGQALTEQTRGLVVSTAIEADNPEIQTAHNMNIPVLHRAQVLADFVKNRPCIAVAGTSGKSTVTGMLGHVLTELGLDPCVINGAPVLDWIRDDSVGNVRMGKGPVTVIEVDESDRSLLYFQPEWAIINNISADHFSLTECCTLFSTFGKQVKRGIVCGPEVPLQIDTVSIGCPVYPLPHAAVQKAGTFQLHQRPISLPLPGIHNAWNALMVCTLVEALGLDVNAATEAIRHFNGLERRLELTGRTGGISVYDDYAHNPEKIKAALTAIQGQTGRVTAIWRPHGFKPLALMRHDLKKMLKETLREGDTFYLLPVFYAGGTTRENITSRQIVEECRNEHMAVHYCETCEDVLTSVLRDLKTEQVILIMGARDPALPVFARNLFAEIKKSRAT